MWKLIPLKLMPPTRLVRYCCSILKETGCKNRYISTGVRWAESSSRKTRGEFEKIGDKKIEAENFSEVMLMNDNDARRRMTELCIMKHKMVVNPIIDWTDSDIWNYLLSEHIQYNQLYDLGYERVGCIGCPMAGKKRWREFADFPQYKKMYIHAFERMLQERKRRVKKSKWKTGEEVFLWWMGDDNIPGQMSIDDYLGGEQ
jgi:phosphoadenosine phosphosulfate reductase